MSEVKFPEIPKDWVPPVPVLTKYWVNGEGFLTLNEDENVLVNQVGGNIALYMAYEVEHYIDYHHTLRWSTEKPTKPGWYWYRDKVGIDMNYVDWTGPSQTQLYVRGLMGMEEYTGEWAGPLPVPLEAPQ